MNNKKIIFVFLIILSSIFLVSCTKKETIFIDNSVEKIELKVEIVNKAEEMQKGLMFHESMPENEGMFFVFDREYQYGFWMKNTLIPLDMVFISKNFGIVDIIYAEPCEEDPCEIYEPKTQAQYVLEVNGHFTTRNNVNIGDKIIIDEKVVKK